MHLLNRWCQYKAYKVDKSNFVFKRMLFVKSTQAHAAFGWGICHLLQWLFFKLAGDQDRRKILDEFEVWPYCTIHLRATCLDCWKAHTWPCAGHKAFSSDRNLLNLAGIQDRQKISDKFKFRPYCTICLRISCLECWKSPYLTLSTAYSFSFNHNFFKLAGFKDRHEIFEKFEFRSYCSCVLRVTCPWMLKCPDFYLAWGIAHSVLIATFSNCHNVSRLES